jgi:uncharacterized BrkB/YihY/UPF0761 family membrane protein
MGVSIRGRQSGLSWAAGYGAWLDLIKVAAREWLADKAPRLGAAVAFYSMLSLAPLLIITVAVIGLAFGEGTARAQIVAQARALIGPQGAEAVAAMIEHARKPGAGILASILGVATLLFGASGVFGELKDALNTIWPKPNDRDTRGKVAGYATDASEGSICKRTSMSRWNFPYGLTWP